MQNTATSTEEQAGDLMVAEPVPVPEPAPPVAAPVKRPFRIDEQLCIFWDRTIYPELMRRTLPFQGTRVYAYPVEDPWMFKALYKVFSSGAQKPWKSVTGSGRGCYPSAKQTSDGFVLHLRLKDPDGTTVLNWLYRARREPDRVGKHCELMVQFVDRYDEAAYEDLRANVVRILENTERACPRPPLA